MSETEMDLRPTLNKSRKVPLYSSASTNPIARMRRRGRAETTNENEAKDTNSARALMTIGAQSSTSNWAGGGGGEGAASTSPDYLVRESGPRDLVALDHFAGLGWGVACERLGIREYGVEIAPSAIRMRSANGMRTVYRDVWTGLFNSELVPEHDLYIASPPCQTFSMAGKGEGRKALDDVLSLIDRRAYSSGWMLEHSARNLDPRTALVLTPLAHIWQHRPRLVALEQVPEVLPVWHACASVLRSTGYSVWVGILRAEQYGVPQTRKRAILMARLDGKVQPPAPTHSRYYSTHPSRLDPGLEKWVSMAEALGWAPDDPREEHAMRGAGQTERHGPRPGRRADQPALTIRANGGGNASGGFVWKVPESWVFERPAPTIVGTRRAEGGMLIGRQLADGSRRDVGGHQTSVGLRNGMLAAVRVTRNEAATLQSFPASMQWRGSKTSQFLAIGNAVPPLLAEAILAALLAPPAELDAWDLAFAEVAG